MSLVAEHLYRAATSGWTHCHAQLMHPVAAWPQLKHNAFVVLDFNDIVTEVWRFEGKADYAAALIEKKVRTEGLVEGAAHIVLHRLNKVPGGFQVYFSALSLELWQQCMEWAKAQSHHCLVMTAAGLLCHGIASGQARVLLSQRRLMCFGQTDEGMVFGTTQALGNDPAGLAHAAQVLVNNQAGMLRRIGSANLRWVTLWSSQTGDAEVCLAVLQRALERELVIESEMELRGEEGVILTAMPKLARAAAMQHVLNPPTDRIAWKAEKWVAPVTVVTACAAVALMGSSLVITRQAKQQRAANQQQYAQLQELRARVDSIATLEAPKKLLPAAAFARALDQGARYDPVAFLALLKTSTGMEVQIQRVRLSKPIAAGSPAFRVDGIAPSGTAVPMTHWISAMMAAGWRLKALDPAERRAGAFSYEVVDASMDPTATARGTKP